MDDSESLRRTVFDIIGTLVDDKSRRIDEATALIGAGSLLDSMKLVELCLLLEDAAADLGFEFDWASAAAMSKSRSMFRTAGSLAGEFVAQKDRKQ